MLGCLLLFLGWWLFPLSSSVLPSPPTTADVIVTEPVREHVAAHIAQKVQNSEVRVHWSEEAIQRDTLLYLGEEEEALQELLRIFARADTMHPEITQRSLKKIVLRGHEIASDTTKTQWHFVVIGCLPRRAHLLEPEETNALRSNPKIRAHFFLPRVPDSSQAVTEELAQLLRNQGVEVQKEIYQ